MSPITITIDDAQVRTALAKLVGRVSDMTPIMEDIGRALVFPALAGMKLIKWQQRL